MIVRLKVNNSEFRIVKIYLFQFYDSPIKSDGWFVGFTPSLGFNSMIVRLKDPAANIHTLSTAGFNSMIVRLKEAHFLKAFDLPVECFNSMIVRLKEIDGYSSSDVSILGFNSMIVRLKEKVSTK